LGRRLRLNCTRAHRRGGQERRRRRRRRGERGEERGNARGGEGERGVGVRRVFLLVALVEKREGEGVRGKERRGDRGGEGKGGMSAMCSSPRHGSPLSTLPQPEVRVSKGEGPKGWPRDGGGPRSALLTPG